MEGRPDNGVLNRLGSRTLGDLADLGPVMQSLVEHPGWAELDEIVEQALTDGMERLIRGGLKDQAQYADHLARLNGLTFHRDVVASVLDKAEWARRELIKAQRETSAAGGR